MSQQSNYNTFMIALKVCMNMAGEYLQRCIIDGRIESGNARYFNNLLALQIDPSTGAPKILGSNTHPDDSHEAIHSYNIRFIDIDENLFNKSSYDFDLTHLDSSLLTMIKMMSTEEKTKLYEELRKVLELEDKGGL